MYQIDDDEIRSKDFSLKLPWLIDRIISVLEVLVQQTDSSLQLTIPVLNGLGYTLDDVKGQLLIINDSLYRSKRDAESTDTDTGSAGREV